MQPLLSKEEARRLAKERQQTARIALLYLQSLSFRELYAIAEELGYDETQIGYASSTDELIDEMLSSSLDHEVKEWADRYGGEDVF